MTTQIVRYYSQCPACNPGTTNIHICVADTIPDDGTHSIHGTIISVSVCQSSCDSCKQYTYTLSYDDVLLADPTTPLQTEDILGLICEDCFTQWVLDHIAPCACIPGNTNTVCGCDTFDPVVQTGALRNTVFGYQALKANILGDGNIAVGYQALTALTQGTENIAIGDGALTSLLQSASHPSIAIGHNALFSATSNNGCIAIGESALYNTNGGLTLNLAIGYVAANACTTGFGIIAIGNEAARYNTIGNRNVHIGIRAGRGASGQTTAGDNVTVGYDSCNKVTTGSYNVSIGSYTGYSTTTAAYNVFSGYRAGYTTTTGSNNVAIGAQALEDATTVSDSVFLGYKAGEGTLGQVNAVTNCIAIGANTFTTKSNQVVIGDANIIETNLRRVLLAAGAAAVGSYPLKFTAGTLLTAPEAGAMEFDGNHLYITTSAGRVQLTP